jgi:hypothetical protein
MRQKDILTKKWAEDRMHSRQLDRIRWLLELFFLTGSYRVSINMMIQSSSPWEDS